MKRLMFVILIFTLVLSFANPSFASEKKYEVKTLDQFLEKVQSKKKSEEMQAKKIYSKGKIL